MHRTPARRAVPLAVPAALLLLSSCGLAPGEAEPETEAPQEAASPGPSAEPPPDLPVFAEMVRAHMAGTWETETEYGGRCEALGAERQSELIEQEGICAALFADWEDSVVFVLGPPASEPFEALRTRTPDGLHWEIEESFVIEDPYAPGPEWLEEAMRAKDDPAQWEISADTMPEVAETWLADRYLPLDCEHGDGGYEGRDAWCPQVEFPEHAEEPPPDGRSSVLLTYNAEPRHRLIMDASEDGWTFTESVAVEEFGHGYDEQHEEGPPE